MGERLFQLKPFAKVYAPASLTQVAVLADGRVNKDGGGGDSRRASPLFGGILEVP